MSVKQKQINGSVLIRSARRIPPAAKDGRRHDKWPRSPETAPSWDILPCQSGNFIYTFYPNLADGSLWYYVMEPTGTFDQLNKLFRQLEDDFLGLPGHLCVGENYNYYQRADATQKLTPEEFEAFRASH